MLAFDGEWLNTDELHVLIRVYWLRNKLYPKVVADL
jgi:hypothetical protein